MVSGYFLYIFIAIDSMMFEATVLSISLRANIFDLWSVFSVSLILEFCTCGGDASMCQQAPSDKSMARSGATGHCFCFILCQFSSSSTLRWDWWRAGCREQSSSCSTADSTFCSCCSLLAAPTNLYTSFTSRSAQSMTVLITCTFAKHVATSWQVSHHVT